MSSRNMQRLSDSGRLIRRARIIIEYLSELRRICAVTSALTDAARITTTYQSG